MVGSFPSNFVQVLDESFRPGSSRGVSPIPGASVSRGSSTSATNGTLGLPSSKPEKTPSKSFRKPFQAYARAGSPNPATITRNPISQRGSVSPQRHMSRQTSTASSYKSTAEGHGSHSMRIRSPASSVTPLRHRSTHSSNHAADDNDSPPPPPPPHRVMYIPQSELNPVASEHNNVARNREFSGQASPAPNSPIVNGQTPSPLRDAMEDVMSSLHDMALHQEVNSQKRASVSPVPWSPDEIDQRYRPGWTRRGARPRSSLGIGGQDELDSDDDYQYDKVESTPGQRPNPLASRPHSSYGDVDEFQSRQNGVPTTLPHDFSDELFFSTKSNMENDKRSIRSRPTAPYYDSRSGFTLGRQGPGKGSVELNKSLKKRKSAYEMGREVLNRTFTTRSNMTSTSSAVQSTTTDLSTSTQLTSASMMSAQSADAFSATSAASLARRKGNITVTRSHPGSLMKTRESSHVDVTGDNPTASSRRQDPRPTGVIYHSGDSPTPGTPSTSQIDRGSEPAMDYFSVTVKPKKSGFFKKMIESAKTGAAGARSSIASGQPTPPHSPLRGFLPNGVTSIAGGPASKPQSGGGTVAGVDWVQVRRDVNRSNSLSQNERIERQERCHMMDHLAIKPVETLQDLAEGDEGADGRPVLEPTNYQVVNFSQVDKSTRFISGLPPMTNSMSLAQGYVCRPYRSDTQRLRAIFTYVSGKVAWEEDFEGEMDTRRVIQTGRGCAEEIAALVMEMCSAIGIHTEVVRGYLKSPGEIFEGSMVPHPNHWWNAVLIDGEWRILDCCLASPTNPKRSQYSSAGSQVVESWWYLVRPVEACYTHVPMKPQQQHICPPLSYEVLFALPCACPPYFKNDLRLVDFDTSMLRTEGLELVHIHLLVPPDIDCVAEVEAKAFETDGDGDYFESGEIIRKRALAQADWFNGEKRYTVKALLPGDEGQGVLKVYAGRKGLMVRLCVLLSCSVYQLTVSCSTLIKTIPIHWRLHFQSSTAASIRHTTSSSDIPLPMRSGMISTSYSRNVLD